MSASNVNNTAAPRQVSCETSDNDHIPVDLDVLNHSGTFKTMYAIGLEEHDAFAGVFPVRTVNSRTFNKVIDWCKEHKDDPEPVIEKDPLTQECIWFTLTGYDKRFFDVPMSQLLELVKAANYLDIPRLYHYACQAVAAWIKRKRPWEICSVLHQDCDLSRAQCRKIRKDNPWLLSSMFSGARIKNAIFIPNEVLVTVFEKLPRQDLERLQLISTQFQSVVVSSSALSEDKGPLRVLIKVDLGAYSHFHSSHRIEVWPRDDLMVACSYYDDLAKCLKFAVVQKLRWSRSWMRLPAIATCNKLDMSGLRECGIQPDDVVEWFEHDIPSGTKWTEPRQLILYDGRIIGGIHGLLTALKTVFMESSSPKPYAVRVLWDRRRRHLKEVLTNDKTHEVLTICTLQNKSVFVERL